MVDFFISRTPNAVHPHTTTKHHVNNAILTTLNPLIPPTNSPIQAIKININNQTIIKQKHQQKHHSPNNDSPTKTNQGQSSPSLHHLPTHRFFTPIFTIDSIRDKHHAPISPHKTQPRLKPRKTPARQTNDTHLHTTCTTSSKPR